MSYFFIVRFVSTDFNCFLKSIRRSIPMTVSVKLTSTRRCMTCSFLVGFFVFYQERDLAICAAVIVRQWEARRDPLVFPNAPLSWSYFGFHSQHSFKFWILRVESISNVWRWHIAINPFYIIRYLNDTAKGVDWYELEMIYWIWSRFVHRLKPNHGLGVYRFPMQAIAWMLA